MEFLWLPRTKLWKISLTKKLMKKLKKISILIPTLSEDYLQSPNPTKWWPKCKAKELFLARRKVPPMKCQLRYLIGSVRKLNMRSNQQSTFWKMFWQFTREGMLFRPKGKNKWKWLILMKQKWLESFILKERSSIPKLNRICWWLWRTKITPITSTFLFFFINLWANSLLSLIESLMKKEGGMGTDCSIWNRVRLCNILTKRKILRFLMILLIKLAIILLLFCTSSTKPKRKLR